MSDTTTPSAAGVMGWDRARLIAAESVTLEGHDTYKPTPDDMLAWLREQEASTFHHGDQVGGFDAGLASSTHRITVVKSGLHTIRTEAPTLHAALEAAVIAVGRAEPECRCYTYHEPMNTGCPLNA